MSFFASSLGLVVLSLLLWGCTSRHTTSDRDLNLIGRRSLQAMLEDKKVRATVVVIDIRRPRAYAEGHIPGALHIAVNDLKVNDPRLTDAKTIVVYGSGKTSDLLSWGAAKKLVAIGYVNVHDFRGGMAEWLGEGQFRRPIIDRRMEEKAQQ